MADNSDYLRLRGGLVPRLDAIDANTILRSAVFPSGMAPIVASRDSAYRSILSEIQSSDRRALAGYFQQNALAGVKAEIAQD